MTSILISFLFSILALVCWVATVMGLPGNWLMVIVATLVAVFSTDDSVWHISWTGVAMIAGLAVLGELLEFVAGSLGVGKVGGSRRAAVFALVGSLAGGVVGLFVGLPIPVVGSLVASLLFSALGAAAGAIIGQRSIDRNWNKSVSTGFGAFWGRLLGTLGKAVCGALIVVITLIYIWF